MEKISSNSTNLNFNLITAKNNFLLEKGQVLQARVISNTPTGVLLEINNTVLEAKTEYHFPINSQLLLTVLGQMDRQTVLSLNKQINYYNLDLSALISDLGFEDSWEIRQLINKLIQCKYQITKENIEKLKLLVNRLPLDFNDAVHLLTDSSLNLAIFAFLNNDTGFSLLLNEKNNKNSKRGYLEISILYQSQKLGLIFTNVNWQEKIIISIKSSLESTYQQIQKDLNNLRQKLNNLVNEQIEIVALLDKNLSKGTTSLQMEEGKPPLLKIDIRI